MTQQQQILANLAAVRQGGINLSNVNMALAAIIDGLSYLVANTPDARGKQ